MKSIVIGTAGHIDHGKTSLVKALTGIDADRLEEEKRRGITIDLGFAHMEAVSPDGERLRFGFVDVPGHERFVRNMLAGVGGIDLVLLVIAADEGIKPQTREHFDICRLLSIQRGIIVLTKSDLVDADTLAVLRMEVEEFVRGSFLENSPMVSVSARVGTGLNDLKRELVRVAARAQTRDPNAIVRLPIDRVFTMKGFGTVVTGTLVTGHISKEDELELFPARRKVRVRGIQVHGGAVEYAAAGERTALNLAGMDKNQLARGMTLASPGLLQASIRMDVKLSLLASARPLKTGARVHLHAFTSEVIATLRLYEQRQLMPGKEGYAQLHLSEPLLLIPGDRFIIRQFSPVITLGGGVLLDAFPLARPASPARLAFLKIFSEADPATILEARVARRGSQGLSLRNAIAETGRHLEEIEAILDQRCGPVRIGELLISSAELASIIGRMTDALDRFHKQNPLSPGMTAELLHKDTGAGDLVFDFALDSMLRARSVESRDGLLNLAGRGVTLRGDEAESRQVIEQAFLSAGLKVPALKDVLSSLKIDKERAQKIVTLLLRDKTLVRVSDDLVFHQSALAGLRSALASQKLKSPQIDVAGFKAMTGVSRKYAIPLLEYLDRERITRRVGEQRIIL